MDNTFLQGPECRATPLHSHPAAVTVYMSWNKVQYCSRRPACSRAAAVFCVPALMSHDVFAGRRTRPVQAGARPSSQATEELITDPDGGQPCGNCVQPRRRKIYSAIFHSLQTV